MKRMKQEGKPYLLKDALDPRAHNAHAKGPSNALELEGDGQGRDVPEEKKAPHRAFWKLSSAELWDWARVLSLGYAGVVTVTGILAGMPALWAVLALCILVFWWLVYPALKRSGVIRGGLW